MPAAVIGGAIAAVGAVGSAVIGSRGASSAANATAAAADRSAQVQQQIYNQNAATLSPYVNAGIPATNAINALLGIGGSAPQTNTPVNDNPQQPPANDIGSFWDRIRNGQFTAQPASPATQITAATQPGTTPLQAYQTAFDNYRNSTGYQFRYNQGMNALNSGWAGRGAIKSGAAMKSALDYGQGIASQEFGNYLAALGNQQGLGLSAASAQAGVGQNYANSLSNIYQTQGNNAANAALVRSQNTANALNSIATIGGGLVGRYG